MPETRLCTERLELRPLPAAAAAALPGDRAAAAGVLGVALRPEWPLADLLDVLPLQAAAVPLDERFGVWVMIELETAAAVVGDIGFREPHGSDGVIEIGYSLVPNRRRRGYATEAGRAVVDWALQQPGVGIVVARCDRGNLLSIRMLERLGFSRVGEASGQLRWRYQGGSARSSTPRPVDRG